MSTKKQTGRTTQTKSKPRKGTERARGGGYLDGKAATTTKTKGKTKGKSKVNVRTPQ